MIELTSSLGATLRVESEEQAKAWEQVGYRRTAGQPKKAAPKKASSSKSSK